MEFTITELLSEEASESWISEHFHPKGLKCPKCGMDVTKSYEFRRTKRSNLKVYRCRGCGQIYNLYSGTIFQQRHLKPSQVVLLVRGVVKGESSKVLAAELGLNYQTVLSLRHALQANAASWQPTSPLPDQVHESDELFQNAGEKRRGTL
ncbi:MAG TPA: zf-TFIIB domain-containing protein [Candidatus Saccharimonadales bacterium]|nr:zf-TFIIB domain-containing protein [Candidatus Saccharimonadales bacterium]